MRTSFPSLVVTTLLAVACGEPTSPSAAPPVARPVAAPAAGRTPAPTYRLATSTLYDRDASGALLATRGDDAVAGFATYAETGGVTSHVNTGGNGGWQLYLGSQKVRTIHLAVTDAGFPVPEGNYYQDVEVYAACFTATGAAVPLLAMRGGDANANCTFGLDVTYGRTKYKLVMGFQYGGTGRALVRCASTLGDPCTSWTIVPAPDVANAGVANLYRYDSRGALVAAGTYHNSYAVGLSVN
jgi:hypothetical protein